MSIENIGNPNPQELRLNNYAKNFLRETARWAKFISIVGFVMIGLLAGFSLLSMLMGIGSSPALDSTLQLLARALAGVNCKCVWLYVLD